MLARLPVYLKPRVHLLALGLVLLVRLSGASAAGEQEEPSPPIQSAEIWAVVDAESTRPLHGTQSNRSIEIRIRDSVNWLARELVSTSRSLEAVGQDAPRANQEALKQATLCLDGSLYSFRDAVPGALPRMRYEPRPRTDSEPWASQRLGSILGGAEVLFGLEVVTGRRILPGTPLPVVTLPDGRTLRPIATSKDGLSHSVKITNADGSNLVISVEVSMSPARTIANLQVSHFEPGSSGDGRITERSKFSIRQRFSFDQLALSLADLQVPDGTRVVYLDEMHIARHVLNDEIRIAVSPEAQQNIDNVSRLLLARSSGGRESMEQMRRKLEVAATESRLTRRGLVQQRNIQYFSPRNVFCGALSLYTALRSCGVKVELSEVVRPDVVSSADGSSLEDLRSAAERFGVEMAPVKSFPADMLPELSAPAILHVSPTTGTTDYSHFILYCGDLDGLAMVYDAPGPIQLMSYGDLSARMSGAALIAGSVGSQSTEHVRSMARSRAIGVGGVAAAALLLCSLFGAATSKLRRWGATSYAAGLVAVYFAGTGILSSSVYGIAAWQEERQAADQDILGDVASELPGPAAFDEWLDEHGARRAIVDSRSLAEFAAGHIPGARSVTITMTTEERLDAMRGVDWDLPIAVYCSSRRCSYSDQIARTLVDDGFEDVVVFRDGWESVRHRFGSGSLPPEMQRYSK